MRKMMFERFVVIGFTTVLAALVLFLTLLSKPSDPVTARRTIDDPIDTELLPEFDPQRPSTQIDPRGQAKKYRISSVNSKGQLIELFGDTLTPLPRGVTKVASPGARIYLEPLRVLQIRAIKGTILAPDNQIRSGEFSGNVRLTLFEGSTSQALDLSDESPDAGLRVFLEDAKFDLELGQIESDHTVHITGPRIDFKGTGLNLIYNQLRHRIDRLEIAHGKSLRFTPDAPPNTESETQNGSTPTATGEHPDIAIGINPDEQAPLPHRQLDDEKTASSPSSHKAAPTKPIQYYRARFEDRVRIHSRYATIEADRLDVVFSLENNPGQKGLSRSSRTTVEPASRIGNAAALDWPSPITNPPIIPGGAAMGIGSGHPLHDVLTQLIFLTQTSVSMGPVVDDHTPAPLEGTGEVMIHWSGRLLIEPEDSPPIDIAGPDDTLVELVGLPVRIVTAENEVISAARIDYLVSEGRIRMFSTDPHPLQIESPGVGVLRAERLVINQNHGTGQILGPGSLQSFEKTRAIRSGNRNPTLDDHTTPDPTDGLTLTWDDRVDLDFHLRDIPKTDPPAPHRLEALKRARFYGHVRGEHEQFLLDSDSLTVVMAAPQANQKTFEQIEAVGNVHVSMRQGNLNADQFPQGIRCDRLTVKLPDAGATENNSPTRLIAQGHVEAYQPDRTMQAGYLEIALRSSDTASAASDTVPELDPFIRTPIHPQSPATGRARKQAVSSDFSIDRDVVGVRIREDLPPTPPLEQPETPAHKPLSFAHQWATDLPAKAPPQAVTPGAGDIPHALIGPVPPSKPLADTQPHHAPLLSLETDSDTSMDNISGAQDSATESETLRFKIYSLFARDEVRIRLNDLMTRIAADRLVADLESDQLELFGIADLPARIERADGLLTGGHIVMNQKGQSVHVPGPGTITFFSTPDPHRDDQPDTAAPQPQAIPIQSESTVAPQEPTDNPEKQSLQDTPPTQPSEEAPAPSDPGVRVTVNWEEAMHFDNRYGLAQFVGDVVSEAWTDQELTQLSAQDIRIEFTELPEETLRLEDATPLTDDPQSLDHLVKTGRTIRTATARDGVVFLTTKWSDPIAGVVETRMRVTGPLVTFDNIMEQIQVIGPGRLLLEDYRVRSKRRKQDPQAASLFGLERTGSVKFTGRGATLMRWSGQLMLDMFHNDMRVDNDVQMFHRSRDSQLTVQLDCQRLLADLEATGGLGAWFADDTPQPSLQAVYADDTVRVLSDNRTILTDHLEYTGFDQTILLRADKGGLTEIQEQGRPTTLTAERFRWNLPANRLEIIKPGASRVPLE